MAYQAVAGTAAAGQDYLPPTRSGSPACAPLVHLLVVKEADAFLEILPPGSNPRGSDRQLANAIKDDLDDYHDGESDGRAF
ncbi:MAG: hypothetical protein GY856_04935 [bacterium]|nr:hypothetical protein [bacterium]